MPDKKKENPSFFSIIPGIVRYDKSLNPYARLLYSELTALTKKEGYAWASNKYLADLYQVERSSISHWIKQLQDAGYIRIELIYDRAHRYIEERRIYLTGLGFEKPAEEHGAEPEPQESGEIVSEETEPFCDGMNNYAENCSLPQGGGYVCNQRVVTNITGGSYKAPRRSLQAINTSSSSDPPETGNQLSGEEEGFEKADNNAESRIPENPTEEGGPQADPLPDVSPGNAFDIPSLKRLLKELNPSFVFSGPFYQKALDFLASSGLDSGYASWLYEFCVKQNPNSIANYFYKVFFDARCAELYFQESRPPPANVFQCPACSTEHGSGLTACPACGLGFSSRKDQKEIYKRKRLFEMPPDTKAAYDEEFGNMYEAVKNLNFREKNMRLDSLDRKYGLAE
jgi:biotin operon repressor